MPLAPNVNTPSVNRLFSTLFPACSWPLHDRMKMLISSVITPTTLSLIHVALLGGGNSFPVSWEIHVQQWEEAKAHLKDVFFCCLEIIFFCMGSQNKNSSGNNDGDCCYKTLIFIFCFMWPRLQRETSWCYSSCPFVIMLWYDFLILSDCSAAHLLFKYRMYNVLNVYWISSGT